MDAEQILKVITEKIDEVTKTRRSDYLTIREACVYLGMKKTALYGIMSRREITYSKPSGKLAYFKKSDLDEYLSRNTIPSISSLEALAADHVVNNAYGKEV